MVEVPPGGWLANEKGQPHYDDFGWCRCCCDDCSHISNPAECMAHPLPTRR